MEGIWNSFQKIKERKIKYVCISFKARQKNHENRLYTYFLLIHIQISLSWFLILIAVSEYDPDPRIWSQPAIPPPLLI